MSRAPVKCKYHTAMAIKEAERQWKKVEIDEKMKKRKCVDWVRRLLGRINLVAVRNGGRA